MNKTNNKLLAILFLLILNCGQNSEAPVKNRLTTPIPLKSFSFSELRTICKASPKAHWVFA